MSSRHLLAPLALSAALAAWPASSPAQDKIPNPGGMAVSADTDTVIVSVPTEGSLRYYDARTQKEVKKVEVDFQPFALVAQGKNLYVSAKGSGSVHVLDAATGKLDKSIKIPGEPIRGLACHPTKGLLYATNTADEVYAIDPETGKATKTKARGQYVVVDPSEGKFVYTGIQKAIRDQLVVEEGPDKQMKLSLVTTGARAMLLKFAVSGKELKLAAFQDNAALNGRSLAVSPDGKRVAMAGGGGWVSKTDPRYSYGVAVFETSDLATMVGQVELGAYPIGLEFHPVLNQGVALRSGGDMVVFNAKSLAKKSALKARGDAVASAFVARGTKLAVLTGSEQGGLQFLSLALSDDDKAALAKAYPK